MSLTRCLLALCLLGLAGCTPDPGDALFNQYVAAIAAAVETPDGPEASPDPPMPPRYPRPRQRTMDVAEVRGGVLELFSLSRCDVSQLIAQRNSILGRHADSASHATLGGAILRRLQNCRDEVDADDEELQSRIDTLIEEKRPALQALRWNASFGSNAFAQWWSLSTQTPIPGEEDTHPIEPLVALQRALESASAGQVDEARQAFSDAYQGFESSESGGAWLLGAQRAISALESATSLLRRAQASAPCDGERKEALKRAYERLYKERIASHTRALQTQINAISAALEPLWSEHAAADLSPPEAVAAFRRQVWNGEGSMARRLAQVQRQHEAAWREWQGNCDALSD